MPQVSPSNPTIEWLLRGDPAVRWQTLRDLAGAPKRVVERERAKISRQGWGARLLAKQQPSGRWASRRSSSDSGLYTPKWISTTYTMMLLRDFGLAPNSRAARKACRELLDDGLQPDGGVSYGTWAKWTKRGEACVTGMILSLLCYFHHEDERLEKLVGYLLAQQMPDGGWNCRRPAGATHSSMHTTISVLEGLRNYELHRAGKLPKTRAAQQQGLEFLLVHRLFRSHRTGQVIRPEFLRFSFPPRWHYDVLRALDLFQSINAPRDSRLADAIEIVHRNRGEDGRWPLQNRYPGKIYFELEKVGEPSRWNTLRALRVLKWWNGARQWANEPIAR